MTDTILAVTVPTLAVLIGILVNNARLTDTNNRIADLNDRIGDLNSRIADLRAEMQSRFTAGARVVEAKLAALDEKFTTYFKMLLDKIEDIDNRLTRLER